MSEEELRAAARDARDLLSRGWSHEVGDFEVRKPTDVEIAAALDALRAALASPSTPEPLEVCPRCGRFSSHDHDVAPSTPEPSGLILEAADALDHMGSHYASGLASRLRAAPSTPEPSGLADIRRAHAVVHRPGIGGPESWCDEDNVRQPCDTQVVLGVLDARSAPSTEPALDVERLALAEHRRAAHRDGSGCTHQWFRASDRSGAIGSVNIEDAAWLAAEYDRLAESQP